MADDAPQFLRATTAFVFADPDKGRRRIDDGTVVAADDPIVAGREALFEPVEGAAARSTAPAAPSARPARKRAPAKRTAKRA